LKQPELKDSEFRQFQNWLHQTTGIFLSPVKKALVAGRLSKRLRDLNLVNYAEYFHVIMQASADAELQTAIDLLTTNETYFFREPKHFDFLRDAVLTGLTPGKTLRIWSAACSSGEEVYSLAMTLADRLTTTHWEILGSDISTQVLTTARNAHYGLARAHTIPHSFLVKYCLKGTGNQEGTFLIDRSLRSRVQFAQINLNERLPNVGEFDVIFLRNVMIYFDQETKRQVVARILAQLKPGGYFFVSHSESLNGVSDALTLISPSTYRKL
jgi:chemotaxis protein methyltransferase CheR